MNKTIQVAALTLFAASTGQAQEAYLPLDDFAGSGQALTLGHYFDGTTTGSATSAAIPVFVANSPAAFSRSLTVFFQGYGGAGQPAPSGSVIIDPVLQRATLSLGGGNCCYTAWNLSAVGVEYSLPQGNWINLAALGDAIRVDWISASSSNVSLGWRVTISDINGRQAVGTRATSGFGTEDIAFTELSPTGLGAPELSRVAKIKVEAITLAAGWGAGFEARWGSIGVAGGIDCNHDGIVDHGQCRDGSLPDYNSNNVPDCCEQSEACIIGNYPVQWRAEDGGNGHWYAAIQSVGLTWDEASDVARSRGGYLAGLQSLTEDFFVRSLTPDVTATGFWIGASRSAGTTCSVDSSWSWLDLSAWAYSGWAATQPDCWATGQDRVAVVRGTYLPGWHDFDNSAVDIARAAIEWSADCNSDGIVDYGQILRGQLVDSDQNGVPDVCEVDPCPGDVTNGGSVDATDLSVILAAWGTNGQGEFDADADNSGLVDGGDLALVLSGWGPCPQ